MPVTLHVLSAWPTRMAQNVFHENSHHAGKAPNREEENFDGNPCRFCSARRKLFKTAVAGVRKLFLACHAEKSFSTSSHKALNFTRHFSLIASIRRNKFSLEYCFKLYVTLVQQSPSLSNRNLCQVARDSSSSIGALLRRWKNWKFVNDRANSRRDPHDAHCHLSPQITRIVISWFRCLFGRFE